MDTSDFSFASMQDAVSSLLVDVTEFLNTTGHPYLVVGGWAPYLRNSTDFWHPGTRDIDILFSDGNIRRKLHDVIRGLLDKGYKASAKHDFQLLRLIKVQDHQLVFNVDLLHPAESVNNPEMMVDHFDLGIRDDELAETRAIKSIVLPSSALLFAEGFSTPFKFTGTDLNGNATNVRIPVNVTADSGHRDRFRCCAV